MANNYNPGDIFIEYFYLDSPRGWLDMAGIFQSGEIYESIFNPGVVGHFTVVDTEDYLGEYKVSGDETVSISFLPPGGITTQYTLNLNAIEDISNTGSLKAKIYKLVCISKEVMEARTNPVTKSWNTQISGMINDIFKNYLNSTKKFNVEATKGVQRYISPNIKPFNVIKELRKRAVSLENKSSNFVFFETVDGFNFVTIESLLKNDIIKKLKHVDTVGSSIPQTFDDNIISYHIKKQAGAIDRIGLGSMNTKVNIFDIRTKKYTSEIKKALESDFGIAGAITSSFFKKTFGNKPGKTIFVNKDSMDPNTHLGEGMPNKTAHLSSLMQNQINLEVNGDTIYKAGKCIWADIPKSVSTTGLHVTESLISGKFLISKLAHIIKKPDARPRYVCSMECLKMGFENGV
jgi:hypothetical protein